MSKEIINITADTKELCEKLARGVWAVCPDAEIRLFYQVEYVLFCGPTAGVGGAASYFQV